MPFARAQVSLDLAIIACDLEQYRLIHHQLPERMDQLDATLPSDVFSGEAYRYQHAPGDRLNLYSVGWNGKDDGGLFRGNIKSLEYRKLPQQQRPDDWAWGAVESDH